VTRRLAAKAPGARAAAETAVGLYFGLAAGGHIISTGLLDSTLILSHEHLVVTNELANQVRSVAGGVRTDAESLAADVIDRCGHPSPEYLFDPHTVANLNRDIYYSDFCGRVDKSYEDWYDKAHRQVTEILDRKPVDAAADKDTRARLAAVEARLKEDPHTWRTGSGDWWAFYVQDFC
jgi:trimethylamine:corrinoid methyltransferase-like protein